ncbi:MAG: nucleoside phosphorylase [Anaerolineae bacterium]|nr:nucleoside phosphorylase [Anaerolineae bacterium]
MTYPILEHDPDAEAFIEPSKVVRQRDMPEACVISFFRDVIDEVAMEHEARTLVENRWEDGPHVVYEIAFKGNRLAFFHPGVGAALSSALLEEVIAFGCRKFVVCGGCGVLERNVATGHLIVVSGAIRDEGTSYHYLPPSREVQANAAALDVVIRVLSAHSVPHLVGKTWTTDGPYRETLGMIQRRRDEGCLTVEMEAAGLMAVAQFRGVPLAQILYAGDDLSGAQWDNRNWQSKADVRTHLFWLAAEAAISL